MLRNRNTHGSAQTPVIAGVSRRRLPELNRRKRLCRPLRNHSAKAPRGKRSGGLCVIPGVDAQVAWPRRRLLLGLPARGRFPVLLRGPHDNRLREIVSGMKNIAVINSDGTDHQVIANTGSGQYVA